MPDIVSHNAADHFVDRHLREGREKKLAFIDDLGSYTYGDFAQRVNRAGNVLGGLGIAAGERVILCLDDGIDFPALFFGAMKIGAVPIPLSTFLSSEDYAHVLRDSGAVAVAVSSSILHVLEPALRERRGVRHVIVCGGENGSFGQMAAGADPTLVALPVEADAIGFWLYSSGSTGRPKGVLHRHASLRRTAVLFGERVLGITQNDVLFSASKLFFAYGLGNSCTFPLHAGATAVLTAARPTPDVALAVIRNYRPSLFFGVPTLFASMLGSLGETVAPSDGLRFCVSAGEALPAHVAEEWERRLGVTIVDGLGSTEALHVFLSNRPGESPTEVSRKPVPGYEVALRDEHGREETQADAVGDLWCRGPSIAAGYWNNPEASARAFSGGWLRTGDKYRRAEDGGYHYVGRTDDMLKVGGLWVSPHEVESVLTQHPAVLEAAVVGAADADSLIKPKAFVVLKDRDGESGEMADELKQFVKDRLAPYKYPRWIEFRAELPRTATGKLRRGALRKSP